MQNGQDWGEASARGPVFVSRTSWWVASELGYRPGLKREVEDLIEMLDCRERRRDPVAFLDRHDSCRLTPALLAYA